MVCTAYLHHAKTYETASGLKNPNFIHQDVGYACKHSLIHSVQSRQCEIDNIRKTDTDRHVYICEENYTDTDKHN